MIKAAQGGYAQAQLIVGTYYLQGQGVAQNDAEALKWLRLAAEQDHALAQFAVAGFYLRGKVVTNDIAEARKWYTRAAEQGLDHAQNSLGYCCAIGAGGVQDLVEAYKWYALALTKTNRDAVVNMRTLLPQMTEAQITLGKLRAASFKPRLSATPNN
jgi:hypothetical protein